VTRVPIVEHVPPDVTAQIFWLKNRDPAARRLADRPHDGQVRNQRQAHDRGGVDARARNGNRRDPRRVRTSRVIGRCSVAGLRSASAVSNQIAL
jgi:hypothetical protein